MSPNKLRRALRAMRRELKNSPSIFSYDRDGLSTIHNADFMNNPRFQKAMERAAQSDYRYEIEWRIHIATWAAEHCMRLPGDFIECGVNRGFTSSAILDYVQWNKTHGEKNFYLMDTFNGLVDSLVNDRERALGRIEMFKERYTECFDLVKNNFSEFENVTLIRGAIPGTLAQCPAQEIAFMHIDMNCAAPEIAALRHFWPRLTHGAMVILDDYGYRGYQPQKDAMDALGQELNFSILSLPTGGGLIIK